ncbi:MAG: metalloregulator ArsR/SmtB family transcription factor [Rhodobacteraceae bacterium]|nr:metalloregulator ArsR/SmtB family transcription factor [Paracoccaceae bacterium]
MSSNPKHGFGGAEGSRTPASDDARTAAAILKTLGHEGRLLLLCHLLDGEKSVTELERRLRLRQSAVSQKLARLRQEDLVAPRRAGKTVYYGLSDPRIAPVLQAILQQFPALRERLRFT